MSQSIGRVLIIAGSDSGGGAGIQADIKAVTARGAYAATALTAITVQNTRGVTGVHAIPTDIVRAQIDAVLEDIGADAVKTGMLGDIGLVEMVADALSEVAAPIVVDPVMIAKGGHPLLPESAIDAVRTLMTPRAALITPNAPEAAALAQCEVTTLDDMRRAGEALLKRGAQAALIKGAHLPGPVIQDLLLSADGARVFESPRIETRHTHGTGCTLASAIAAELAQGAALEDAVEAARDYLHEAIRRAPGFGAGHGPVDHAWPLRAARSCSPKA